MKKNTPSPKTFKTSSIVSIDSLYPLIIGFVIFAASLIMSSCSDDEHVDNSADIAKLVGTYQVADKDKYDEVENYSVTITKANEGGDVEISNFGDFMYVPVKAEVSGNVVNIPTQTFKGKSMTITLSGKGTLSGNVFTFDYLLETDDDYSFPHNCTATKMQ